MRNVLMALIRVSRQNPGADALRESSNLASPAPQGLKHDKTTRKSDTMTARDDPARDDPARDDKNTPPPTEAPSASDVDTEKAVGRANGGSTEAPEEQGGPPGPEPTRFGDWERKGRCIDF